MVLLGAWFVTLRMAAQWEARKKRAELDITLARDFYKLIGSFKAIAREGQGLGARPGAGQPGADAWDEWHADLLRRAITAEADMEAILLALISEGSVDEDATEQQRRRRLHSSGLLRVAFRSLREQIEHREMRSPTFGDPLFWLMNRLQGELSRSVFARSVRKMRQPGSKALRSNAEDYLNLIAYRTADLEVAAGRLAVPADDFRRQRGEARFRQRDANVRHLFRPESIVVATSMTVIPPLANASMLAVISNRKAFPDELDRDADNLLAAHGALTHVLFVGDHLDLGQPPGSEWTEIHAVYVKPRGVARVICKPDELLPADLPYKTAAELLGIPRWLPRPAQEHLVRRLGGAGPARGVNLLAWTLDEGAKGALRRVAAVEI